ncbi:MAG TPA: cobalamin-binding protein [Rubrobacter sp.]|nr:cobalamin-binding protein [Rubrobacter sp.]
MRVASLLPSATEIVCFAGAESALVGVTHECDYPPGVEALPKLTSSKIQSRGDSRDAPISMTSAEIDSAVRTLTDEGSIYALDAELLERLSPDLVITQGLCEVCAVSINVVEAAVCGMDYGPEILSLNPTSLAEVLDDAARIGEALGHGEETRVKITSLEERLANVEERVAHLSRPRVGCIEWLDPPFSAGHWVPEMVRLAGGEEIFAGPGEPSVELGWNEVFEGSPDVLILMPCGFDAERTAREALVVPQLSDLQAEGRVWVVDANSYFSRPAPRLVEGVEILARVLHPEVFTGAPETRDARPLTLPAQGGRESHAPR